MSERQDGTYDERLLQIILVVGVLLFVLFAATPVLRPYYALMMPAVITVIAGLAWSLLRSGRLANGKLPPVKGPDEDETQP